MRARIAIDAKHETIIRLGSIFLVRLAALSAANDARSGWNI